MYVAGGGDRGNTVSAISSTTNKIVASIHAWHGPQYLAYDARNHGIYVMTNIGVSVITPENSLLVRGFLSNLWSHVRSSE